MPRIDNIAVKFANLPEIIDLSDFQEIAEQRPYGYRAALLQRYKNGQSMPPVLPGVEQEILDLMEDFKIRLTYFIDDTDCTYEAWFKKFKTLIRTNPKARKIFLEYEIALHLGAFLPWYHALFDLMTITGELNSDVFAPRADEFYHFRYEKKNFFYSLESHIFYFGVMLFVEKMCVDFFRKLKVCDFCGEFFFGNRKARYCSASCRSWSSRVNRGLLPMPEKIKNKPIRSKTVFKIR